MTTNCYGKPCLGEESALYFNVTHSEGMGVIAFTTVGEVGIDVEAVARDVEASEIASVHFTGIEAAMVRAGGRPENRPRSFFASGQEKRPC